MDGDLCPTAVIRCRGPVSGPFFTFSDGKPLTLEHFVTAVRRALAAAGVNSSCFAGHSFRIGAATTAAQQGVQDSITKTMGRWESSAYTHTPRETLCSITRILVETAARTG